MGVAGGLDTLAPTLPASKGPLLSNPGLPLSSPASESWLQEAVVGTSILRGSDPGRRGQGTVCGELVALQLGVP